MAPPVPLGGKLEELMEALAREASPLRRRQMLLAARDQWSPEAAIRLADETVRRMYVDIPQAERMARAAAWLGARVASEKARAAGLRAMGHILERKRRYQAALSDFELAREILEGLGEELEIGRTLNSSLHCLMYLGRYEEALAAAGRAAEIFQRLGDRARLARVQANMANIMHRQDRFEEALDLDRRACAALVEHGEPRDVAVTLQNMATCQIGMNDFRGALETYERARAYCQENELPLLLAVADYNIAYLYYLRGEYTRAIAAYRAARKHCRKLGDAYREALCDLDQSEMYVELNLNEEGAQMARRAIAAFRKLGNLYEAAKAMTNLAIAASHHGNASAALELFRKARELFTREGNRAWIATIDLYQALVFYRERRLTEARLLAESAREFFAPSSFQGKAILCQLLLARIHLESGRGERAREICLEAVGKLEQAESPVLNFQAHFVLGLIEEHRGGPDAAREAYGTAHREMESLRSHLHAEEIKIAFLKDKLEVYEALVHMCLTGGGAVADPETAFRYIEQAKSRSLADLIAFRAHQLPAPASAHGELVEQARAWREELNWYSRAMQFEAGQGAGQRGARLEKLRRKARECEHRLTELIGTLRLEDREFATLQGTGAIDMEAIRASLPENAVLLEYYRVRDTFYACVMSRRKLKIVPVAPVPELRRALQLLRFQLSKFRLGADYVSTFQAQLLDATNAHLRHFHASLVAPLASDLEAEHLIITPHDFLHYVPFHALLDGDDYLGSRYSISYAPSATVYHLCAAKQPGPGQGALVLGVPDPAAPQIGNEVEAVASVLPEAEIFLGREATYDVLRERGAGARYIHIATHGWFRQDNPMFSSISLGTSELSLFDLYQLNLPAELITLSGCGTGLDMVVGGDELIGLKRGLLYAGARGLLLTLWDVQDESAAEFMKLFYRRLKQDPNKARAVQYAMTEIRREYPHPFYWAPFELVGRFQ
jgi:CHAT domain-containing protein/tetratricopeptide (TPR) repeat protein